MKEGKVKFFNEAKGYGFIIESESQEEYFVHVSGLIDQIKEDDEALMHFSFKYLANTLFGAQGMQIKKEKLDEKIKEIKERQDESLQKAEQDYLELKAERDRMLKEQESK